MSQRDRHQQRDRTQGIDRRRFDHTGCTRFQIDGAVNVQPLPPDALFKQEPCECGRQAQADPALRGDRCGGTRQPAARRALDQGQHLE
jgi:hypothetical protein